MCKEEVKLSRSEMREQAFMLLFSKSFDDQPLEETIEDNAEMFRGGVCPYAQAVVIHSSNSGADNRDLVESNVVMRYDRVVDHKRRRIVELALGNDDRYALVADGA